MSLPRRIRVLVVDDSPVVRQVLARLLEADPGVGDVYTAPNGSLALRKIKKLEPDVVTLDVEMPGMDGLETLRSIMRESPRPVVMVSASTHEGAEKTLQALALGALDFIAKPAGRLSRDIAAIGRELCEKVHAVAGAPRRPVQTQPSEPPRSTAAIIPSPLRTRRSARLIAIGASTGGTDATRWLLSELPADLPVGVVIVQHMPPGFTTSYARRLNEVCPMQVKEAAHRDLVLPGRALLAPGDQHMVVRADGEISFVELHRGADVNGHRPSVDVLFESVAQTFGAEALGVLLTGMGRDGATGLGAMKLAGAVTFAQSEASCVVFGMPKVAIAEGAADVVASPKEIGAALRSFVAKVRLGGTSTNREMGNG